MAIFIHKRVVPDKPTYATNKKIGRYYNYISHPPQSNAVEAPAPNRITAIKRRVQESREQMITPTPVPESVQPDIITKEPLNRLYELQYKPLGMERILFLLERAPISRQLLQKCDKRLYDELQQYPMEANLMSLDDLRVFIADKTIALVSNSGVILEQMNGEEIDNHDIVIRFNSYAIAPEFTGIKTTIHASIHLQRVNLDVYTPIRLIIAPNTEKWQIAINKTSRFKQGVFVGYYHYFPLLSVAMTHFPFTTGFNTFLLLQMIGGYKKLTMYGFDAESAQQYTMFRTTDGYSHPISEVHNYGFEKEILRRTASTISNQCNYTFDGNCAL